MRRRSPQRFDGPTGRRAVASATRCALAKVLVDFAKEQREVQDQGRATSTGGRSTPARDRHARHAAVARRAARQARRRCSRRPRRSSSRVLVAPGAQLARARRGAARKARRVGERRLSAPRVGTRTGGRASPAGTATSQEGDDMADLNAIADQLSTLTVIEAAELVEAARGEVGRVGRRSGRRRRPRRAAAARRRRRGEDRVRRHPRRRRATRRSTSSRRSAQSPASASRRPRTWSRARPKPVKEGVSKDEAEKIKEKLEAAGAQVDVK